jgi:hypothetical protein
MYRSRVRSGVSLTCGGASKARYKRSKSSAFDFELPGRPATVARLRGFGERRAVTLLLCLGIFRLQDKSALTSMFETPQGTPIFGSGYCKSGSQGTGIRATTGGPPCGPCCLGVRDKLEPLDWAQPSGTATNLVPSSELIRINTVRLPSAWASPSASRTSAGVDTALPPTSTIALPTLTPCRAARPSGSTAVTTTPSPLLSNTLAAGATVRPSCGASSLVLVVLDAGVTFVRQFA